MTAKEEKLTKEVQDLKEEIARLKMQLCNTRQRVKDLSDQNMTGLNLLRLHSENSDRWYDKYMAILEKLHNLQECSCANHECKDRKTYFVDNNGDISL